MGAERVIGGGLLGALVGLVVVRLMPESNTVRCSGDVCTSDRKPNPAIVVGAASGVVLGIVRPVDRWQSAPPPVRVGLGRGFRGARVGVSLAF